MTVVRCSRRAGAVLSLTALTLALFFSPKESATQTPAGSGVDTPQLVKNVVRAYGGRKAVEGMVSLAAKGEIDAPMLYARPAAYVRLLKRGRKLRVETKYDGSRELRILNGDRGYYAAPGAAPAEVQGARYLAMVYQYKELTMPYQLLTGHFSITDAGRALVKGRQTAVLALHDQEGPPMKIYVDLKRFLILKDSGMLDMGGETVELASVFGDFRMVDGVVLPFTIVNYAGDERIGETRIFSSRVNPPLDDRLFEP